MLLIVLLNVVQMMFLLLESLLVYHVCLFVVFFCFLDVFRSTTVLITCGICSNPHSLTRTPPDWLQAQETIHDQILRKKSSW